MAFFPATPPVQLVVSLLPSFLEALLLNICFDTPGRRAPSDVKPWNEMKLGAMEVHGFIFWRSISIN